MKKNIEGHLTMEIAFMMFRMIIAIVTEYFVVDMLEIQNRLFNIPNLVFCVVMIVIVIKESFSIIAKYTKD